MRKDDRTRWFLSLTQEQKNAYNDWILCRIGMFCRFGPDRFEQEIDRVWADMNKPTALMRLT